MLQVIEQEGQLVVDSRLIADELGIEHRSFKDTIRDNAQEIEEAFGVLRRETADGRPLPQGGSSNPETYYLLTEDQATYLMTLSRNTEQVKLAKRNLVKAFSTAKQALVNIQQQAHSALNQTVLAEVLLKLDALQVDQNRMNQLQLEKETRLQAAIEHPGCANILDSAEDDELTTKEYLVALGLDLRYLRKISRRATTMQRVGTNDSPKIKRNNQVVLKIQYLKEATKSVLGLD